MYFDINVVAMRSVIGYGSVKWRRSVVRSVGLSDKGIADWQRNERIEIYTLHTSVMYTT